MTRSKRTLRIRLSLPADLVAYLDGEAERLQISRSQVISQALAERRAAEREALAGEGYQFYAEEAASYADATAPAVSEAIAGERWLGRHARDGA